jgi:hypothetical protein
VHAPVIGNKSNGLTQNQTAPGYVCSATHTTTVMQEHQITGLPIYFFLSKEEELHIPCLNLHASATSTKTVGIQTRIRCKTAVEVET